MMFVLIFHCFLGILCCQLVNFLYSCISAYMELIELVYTDLETISSDDFIVIGMAKNKLWSNKYQNYIVFEGGIWYNDCILLTANNRYMYQWFFNYSYVVNYYYIKKFRKLLKTKFPELIF